MAGFEHASDYTRFALILLLVNLLVHILAFSAPYWSARGRVNGVDARDEEFIMVPDGHAGLWQGCTHGQCYECYNLFSPRWVRACQALMTASLVLLVVMPVLLVLYVWHRDFDRDSRLVALALVAAFLATLATTVTVVVWLFGQHLGDGEYLSWGFALACLSALLGALATWQLALEMHRPLKEPQPRGTRYAGLDSNSYI